ncbi:hypothetical protein [Roseibacillus ishigakijimensis]|nr:hypothetical protein [Roseibacillus ishigakijimensis]
MRKWFGERVLQRLPAHPTRLDGERFLGQLLAASSLELTPRMAKRSKLDEEEIVITRDWGEEKSIVPLAEVGLLFGLALLGKRQPELLRWREWALKFSWAFPAFLILVVIFSALVGSFVRWILPAVSVGLGVGTLVGFIAAWVEWQAATLTSQFLQSRAIIAREDDRIAISKAMRALAARHCVPGMLQLLFPEAKRVSARQREKEAS